jgi:acetyl-CoA carboxylase carboxyl transferase subunit alpha
MGDDMLLEFEKPVAEIESKLKDLEARRSQGETEVASEITKLQAKYQDLKDKMYSNLSPWQRVQLARHPKRPYFGDYVPRIFDDFMEIHGDRAFGDDAALMCGLATFEGQPVAVIGHKKGRTLQEALEQNFGMPHPEGYRKAMRLMEMAERFKMPVLTFVDTAGAYPGIGAEERGQAEAIARSLREMAALKTPIVVTVIGEGGSGGALAIAVGDAILMLENAWYSVISPEGCAAILFHDATKAELAAKSLKLTATDLKGMGIIDEIVPEPVGGAQRDPDLTASALKDALRRNLASLKTLSVEQLLAKRFEKFRSMGAWQEKQEKAAPATPRRSKKKQS